MKKTIALKKRLNLSKEKLNQLNEEQLGQFMGGRMAMATWYTSGSGNCSFGNSTNCCSWTDSACCG